MVQDEQFLSCSESGLRFLMDRHFPVWKQWSRSDNHFRNENGPDQTIIFVMKMVRKIVDVP
jgi:hypothetical protein